MSKMRRNIKQFNFSNESQEKYCSDCLCRSACNVVLEDLEYCQDRFTEEDEKREGRNKRQRENRRAFNEAMRSCGLVKVKGNLGGTYWE